MSRAINPQRGIQALCILFDEAYHATEAPGGWATWMWRAGPGFRILQTSSVRIWLQTDEPSLCRA